MPPERSSRRPNCTPGPWTPRPAPGGSGLWKGTADRARPARRAPPGRPAPERRAHLRGAARLLLEGTQAVAFPHSSVHVVRRRSGLVHRVTMAGVLIRVEHAPEIGMVLYRTGCTFRSSTSRAVRPRHDGVQRHLVLQ